MTFAEVLPALLAGRKIRRTSWTNREYLISLDNLGSFSRFDIVASDWELVEEPAKPDTVDEAWKRDALHWMEQYGTIWKDLSSARATIARLERDLAEAKQRDNRFRAALDTFIVAVRK